MGSINNNKERSEVQEVLSYLIDISKKYEDYLPVGTFNRALEAASSLNKSLLPKGVSISVSEEGITITKEMFGSQFTYDICPSAFNPKREAYILPPYKNYFQESEGELEFVGYLEIYPEWGDQNTAPVEIPVKVVVYYEWEEYDRGGSYEENLWAEKIFDLSDREIKLTVRQEQEIENQVSDLKDLLHTIERLKL